MRVPKLVLPLCTLVLILSAQSAAQDSLNVTKVGDIYNFWGEEWALDIELIDTLAFMAVKDAGLRIISIADPENPVEIGYNSASIWAEGVSVSDDYAFIADAYFGLRVYDIHDLSNPIEISCIPYPDYIHDVSVSGDYAYLGDEVGVFHVIDISDPSNPVEIGTLALPPSTSVIYEIEVVDSLAYVAGGPYFFWILNISNPAEPTIVSNYNGGSLVFDFVLDLDNNLVYLSCWVNVQIIDISDIYSPLWLSTYNGFAFPLRGLAVDDQAMFIAYGGGIPEMFGIEVVDISNLYSPVSIGFCNTPDQVQEIAISGDYAFVAAWSSGLRIIDISDQYNPQEIALYSGYANDVVKHGDYAYLATKFNGLKILNCLDPLLPFEVADLDLPGGFIDVCVQNGYAYTTNGYEGFSTIDVSDPNNPVVTSSISLPDYTIDLDTSDSYLYVINYGIPGNLWVYAISNPSEPSLVGSCSISRANSVVASDGVVYVGTRYNGLYIIDVSNASNPTVISGLWDVYITALEVSGNYLYAGLYDFSYSSSRVIILDISISPLNPDSVGWIYPYGDMITSLEEENDHLFITYYNFSLKIYDVSNPSSPALAGYYYSGNRGESVAYSNGLAYVAERYMLSIYDCSAAVPVEPAPEIQLLPSSYALSAHPNPFNPTTTLTFSLPVASNVRLEIYDINGRSVGATHASPLPKSKWYPAGIHNLLFDGSDLSSGIYFVKMEAANFSQVQKVVLMK